MTTQVSVLTDAVVSIHVETDSGYSSTERFSSAAPGNSVASPSLGIEPRQALLSAWDELTRMLILTGLTWATLENRYDITQSQGGD